MKNLTLLSAVAVVAALVAAPVMAKDASSPAPGKQSQASMSRQHHATLRTTKHAMRMTPRTANANASLENANAEVKRSDESLVTSYAKVFFTPGNASGPVCTKGQPIILADGEQHICQ